MAALRLLACVLLLCGRVSAQEERAPWSAARRVAVVRAWQAAEEPLARAAIGRLVWERAATDPLERRACADLADATPEPVGALLRRLADPPPLEQEGDVEALALLAGPAPTDPFEEVRRVLRLASHVEGAGPDDPVVARLTELPQGDPLAVALRRVRATRGAFVALRTLDELRAGRDRQGAALDEALDQLARPFAGPRGPETPAETGFRRFEREVRACGLAALAARSGRPWLAHALLAPIELLDDRVAGATSIAANERLSQVVRDWRQGLSVIDALDRLAPVLRTPGHVAARALDAALRRNASFPPVAPPSLETWDGWGQDERLAALDAALCAGTPLATPFPPDAPLDERGERPTLGQQLEALGWAAVPMLIARVDEGALLRTDGPGPLGLGRVSDLALEALEAWGAPRHRSTLLAERRQSIAAWWEVWSQRGPQRCWQEAFCKGGSDWAQLPPGAPLRLARMLGSAAAPIVSATLASLPAGSPERAAWLDAAVALRDEAYLPELTAAARSGQPELALVGARGLLAVGDEAARAEAAWVARVAIDHGSLEVGQGLGLLRRLDPATARRLEREVVDDAKAARPLLVRFLRRDLAEVDARLALLRLAALRLGRFATSPDDEEAWLTEDGATALGELTGRPGQASDRREAVEAATAALLRDAPAWSADPARRVHAVVTALLLGPDALERLAKLPGLDPRAIVAQALVDPDPAVARRLRAGLGPRAGEVEAWLRTWLAEPAAAGRLEGPNPTFLLVGEVVVRAGGDTALPADLAAKALTLARSEVTSADLHALLRAGLDAVPGLQLRLVRPAWGAWRLELAPHVGGPAGLCAVVHGAARTMTGELDGRAAALLLELVAECRAAGAGPAELHVVATR